MSSFGDPELVWRISKRHHVGFVLKSRNYDRVTELLNSYAERVRREYHASAPAREKVRE
jgi:DNA-binding LytR/AlgR family response regulator